MSVLRAAIDGCEIEVTIEDGEALSDDLRDALIGVAQAMAPLQDSDQDEVSGFSGLNLGALRSSPIDSPMTGWGCWGYAPGKGGACTWYTADEGDDIPDNCTIYTIKAV